ncbi:DUF3140 domain-containing protein [Croceiramulus getboli]|nr:DUF3140 domain-containing protein [Flavobacteriaceae bacterium YJPT1-3]
MDFDKEEIWNEFEDTRNMGPSELEEWLATEASKNAGKEMDNGETVGHSAGRSLVDILRKDKEDLTEANWDRIKETVNVYRQKIHPTQKPSGDLEGSAWYKALKNWGYDALKDD